MPICPNCKTEQTKRVAGACPNCKAPVNLYKGHWFREAAGSPGPAIVAHLEKLVSRALTKDLPVYFAIAKSGARYTRELVSAERLLRECDWDLDLVLETLDVLFNDNRFNYRVRDSLMYIAKDFTTASAVAKANRAAKVASEQRANSFIQQVMQREDLFS